jgi:5-(carboxyamino)imidazole ribonucleotide synthase
MINLIGSMPERTELLSQADLHWHDYGKEPRPGRKLGHLTVVADSASGRDRIARRVLKRVDPDTAWPNI